MNEKQDIVIVGGGILGTGLAYWLSQLYQGRIVLVESDGGVARQTSGRNTGVIHRPFYLNPDRRKTFARCAQISYGLWKSYAQLRGLPWKEIRTIEVATEEHEVPTLHKYMKWALQNGMDGSEIEYLSPEQVRKIEPHVHCHGAVYSKTDTAVDYRTFTEALQKEAEAAGVKFLLNHEVSGAESRPSGVTVRFKGGQPSLETKFLINCAGGNAVDIAHLFGVGMEYTDLHFRGEYWQAEGEKAGLVNTNIYSVPRHAELPFLDPHWIVRADGRREIGPNAVLVAGSRTYDGFFSSVGELVGKVFEAPLANKFRLFTNPEFLRLAAEEWQSSISKSSMVKRVQKFIPEIGVDDFTKRGTAGVRSSVIDSKGNFMKEAIEFSTANSFHIINYNSPGATGAPAYTALLADKLSKSGALSHLQKKTAPQNGHWNYKEIIEKTGA
jgi:L-2-hydroxyglutarate oxidase